MKKTIKKVFQIILISFISLVLIIFISLWNIKSLKSEVLPMPFDMAMAVILTDSMEKELSVNDLVIIKKTNDYTIDDVVAFDAGDKIVVHRIIRIDDNGIITTKGDANEDEDPSISVDKIKGEVIKSYPKIGLMIRTIKSPAGSIILLVTSVLLLIISFLAEREENKELENRKEPEYAKE